MLKLSSRTIGTLLGFSRWQTPWQCFKEKVTKKSFCNITPAMLHGIKYEKDAIAIYSIHTKNKCSMFGKSIEHPKYSFITGKIDGFIEDKNILIEVKCPYKKKNFDENMFNKNFNIDKFYWVQVQIYMEIMNINETHFIEYYRSDNVSHMRYKSIFRDKQWFIDTIPMIKRYYNEILFYKKVGIDKHPVENFIKNWENAIEYNTSEYENYEDNNYSKDNEDVIESIG